MDMMDTASDRFIPPKPSKFWITLAELLLPIHLRFFDNLSVEFDKDCDSVLHSLADKRVVFVINHADRNDPLVVLALAKHLRQILYCIAAREVFDWDNGLRGWIFQRLGCYSVDRGVIDIPFIRTTQRLLKRIASKLVAFPQGEITGDDRQVREINQAFVHVLMRGQEELGSESIMVLPVGVVYSLDAKIAIAASVLKRIERQLGIKNDPCSAVDVRVQNAIETVIVVLNSHYKNSSGDPATELAARVDQLARHICSRIADCLEVKINARSAEELMHKVRNHVTAEHASRFPSTYEKRIHSHASWMYQVFLDDLDRVERLLVCHRLLLTLPSDVRTCRLLDFLEAETCGRMSAKGHQTATVFFAKPIDLSEYLPAYKDDKSTAIRQLSESIKLGLQHAVDKFHRNDRAQSSSRLWSHIPSK